MREVFVLAVDRHQAPAEAFTKLLRVVPSGFEKTEVSFNCQLPWDSESVQRVLGILGEHDLIPWNRISSQGKHDYWLVRRRDYDASDFHNCKWLQAESRWASDFTLAGRRADGRLEIEPRFFKRRIFLEKNFTPSLIVSRQVRQWMGEAGLIGMVFHPTAKVKGRGAADEDNLWELTTEHVLPPMSPRCTWFDEHGTPTEGGSPERGRILKEDFYSPVEYHYLAPSLNGLAASDFFLTWERFWQSGARQERRLVVSRRFYDFCQTKQLEMEWIPVRIDSD